MARLWELRLRLEPSPSGPRSGVSFLSHNLLFLLGVDLGRNLRWRSTQGKWFPIPCSFIGGKDPWHLTCAQKRSGYPPWGWGHISRIFGCCWSTRSGGVCLGPLVDTGKGVWLSLWGSSLHAIFLTYPLIFLSSLNMCRKIFSMWYIPPLINSFHLPWIGPFLS